MRREIIPLNFEDVFEQICSIDNRLMSAIDICVPITIPNPIEKLRQHIRMRAEMHPQEIEKAGVLFFQLILPIGFEISANDLAKVAATISKSFWTSDCKFGVASDDTQRTMRLRVIFEVHKQENNHSIYPLKGEDGYWGVMSFQNPHEWLIEPGYRHLNIISDELICVGFSYSSSRIGTPFQNDNHMHYSMITAKASSKVIISLTNIFPIYRFYNGYALICHTKGHQWMVVDTEGNKITKPEDMSENRWLTTIQKKYLKWR